MMNTLTKTALILGAFAAAAVWWTHRSDRPDRLGGRDPVITAAEADPAELAARGHETRVGGDAGQRASGIAIINMLQSADGNRWISAMPLLAALRPAQQWQVLMSPGVFGQVEAKALRGKMIRSCIGRMAVKDVAGKFDSEGAGLVSAWCADLERSGDFAYFSEQARALSSDVELKQYFGLISKRNFKESKEKQAGFKAQVAAARSEAEVVTAVLAAWDSNSLDELAGDAAGSLSHVQRGNIQRALTVAVACRIAGSGCGPFDSSLVSYCALTPGAVCLRGQNLDQILRNNLSPIEYGYVKRISTYVGS